MYVDADAGVVSRTSGLGSKSILAIAYDMTSLWVAYANTLRRRQESIRRTYRTSFSRISFP